MQAVWIIAVAILWLGTGIASAAEPPADPLKSVMWQQMYRTHFADKPVVFDDRVRVIAPKLAEDQAAIPVTVDASALYGVREIVVIADLNPIQKVLSYRPVRAKPYIAFRFKAEQGTPVRAAALTQDGVWHLGGVYVDAAGGGCSSPALAHGKPDWVSRLAEVRGKIWRQPGQSSAKLRLRIQHPMDTGLADGIPPFFVERLELQGRDGAMLGTLQIYEPVSENPVLTLKPRLGPADDRVIVKGRDTDGNLIRAVVPVNTRASALEPEPSRIR
jgi:sulfur-oxidizing protein SoxY